MINIKKIKIIIQKLILIILHIPFTIENQDSPTEHYIGRIINFYDFPDETTYTDENIKYSILDILKNLLYTHPYDYIIVRKPFTIFKSIKKANYILSNSRFTKSYTYNEDDLPF